MPEGALEVVGETERGIPIVALPGPPATISGATRFRSTWVVSTLEGIRQHGDFDRYQRLLGEHREQVVSCIAGSWLPMEAARAHYQACDQLRLSDEDYARIAEAGAAIRRAWYASLLSGVKGQDATPWTVLPMLQRVWMRTVDGGAVGVFQLAPNEARVDYVGCELFDIPYFHRAVRVMMRMLAEHTRERVEVRGLRSNDPRVASFWVGWR